jgi:hypothetical protein
MLVGSLLDELVNTENGRDLYLRNVCLLSTDYMALCPRRHNSL